jgi:hypothetical protein
MKNGRTFYKRNTAGVETPLPSHYAMRFMRRHIDFSQHPRPADLFLISTNLDACAIAQDDGLVLLVVNYSESENETKTLNLRDGRYEQTAIIDTMSKGWNGEWEIGVTNQQTGNILGNGSISWDFPPQTITAIKLTPATTNRPPVTQSDLYQIVQNRSAELPVLENDTDLDGDSLSILDYTTPQYGTLSLTDGIFHYQPPAYLLGTDSFSYRVADSSSTSSYATVQISVVPNQVPLAQSDQATTLQNTPVSIPLLANDSDPNGDPLSIQYVSQPFYGTVTHADGQALYTPNTDYIGSDTFSYAVEDPSGAVSTSVVVRVVVGNKQLHFFPAVDSFIYEKEPDSNFGTRTSLDIRGIGSTYTRIPYLRFVVSGLQSTDQILGVSLGLQANQFDGTLTAYSVPNNSWGETSITWNNAPAASTNALGSTTGHSDEWIVIPLSAQSVSNNAAYSFDVEASGNWLQTLKSRESGIQPQLTLTLWRTADTDDDTLRDEWETTYAGNLTTLSKTGDYDGDGISDYEEYIFNSDPTTPSEKPNSELAVLSPSEVKISVDSDPARLYFFEYSTNLIQGFWQQLEVPQKGQNGTLDVLDSTISTEAMRYYRIKVSAP